MINKQFITRHIYALIIVFSSLTGFSQSLPFNFEGDITTSDFSDFDGGVATVVANPNPSGINTSASVAQIVRDEGASWSGSKILLADNLDFSVKTKITMKVYTKACYSGLYQCVAHRNRRRTQSQRT